MRTSKASLDCIIGHREESCSALHKSSQALQLTKQRPATLAQTCAKRYKILLDGRIMQSKLALLMRIQIKLSEAASRSI
jgi:hypothetical protein